MTETQQSVVMFLLVCVFSTVGAQTAQDSPQQHISLIWVDEMYPEICWLPPPETSVKYKICVSTKDDNPIHEVNISSEEYCTNHKTIMFGGFVKFFVNTPCEDEENNPAVISYINPVLAETWECVIHSSSLTHCSWKPTPDAPDLRFFYILRCALIDCSDPSPIRECPFYTYTGTMRTGCNLQMRPDDTIDFLLNGTTTKGPVRNTYTKTALNVKPPTLNWTVTKTKKKFNISWIPPDLFDLSKWTFSIKYTRCDGTPITEDKEGATDWILEREPSCQYRISIRAETNIYRGGTEWSQEKIFDADSNLSLFAAIIIPLVLAVVVILTLVCCRQNKESIFPKVPVPRDLLSDISENNNKITVGNLYSPEKEEEDCKITLVVDPQISKLDA